MSEFPEYLMKAYQRVVDAGEHPGYVRRVQHQRAFGPDASPEDFVRMDIEEQDGVEAFEAAKSDYWAAVERYRNERRPGSVAR